MPKGETGERAESEEGQASRGTAEDGGEGKES
jgi:hypothetical protein